MRRPSFYFFYTVYGSDEIPTYSTVRYKENNEEKNISQFIQMPSLRIIKSEENCPNKLKLLSRDFSPYTVNMKCICLIAITTINNHFSVISPSRSVDVAMNLKCRIFLLQILSKLLLPYNWLTFKTAQFVFRKKSV